MRGARRSALHNSHHGETPRPRRVRERRLSSTFAPLLVDAPFLPSPARSIAPRGSRDRRGHDVAETQAAIELLRAHAHELTALVPAHRAMRREDAHAWCGLRACSDRGGAAARHSRHRGRDRRGVWTHRPPVRLRVVSGTARSPSSARALRGTAPSPVRWSGRVSRRLSRHPSRSFMHSHTFTANPVACAAGVAACRCSSMRPCPHPGTDCGAGDGVSQVADACEAVSARRQAGMIVASDLARDAARNVLYGRVSLAIREAALARGVLLGRFMTLSTGCPCSTSTRTPSAARARDGGVHRRGHERLGDLSSGGGPTLIRSQLSSLCSSRHASCQRPGQVHARTAGSPAAPGTPPRHTLDETRPGGDHVRARGAPVSRDISPNISSEPMLPSSTPARRTTPAPSPSPSRRCRRPRRGSRRQTRTA